MVRTKVKKYNEVKKSKFVIDQSQEIFFKLKGNWGKLFFKNKNPIILELACGRGEYTIGLAKQFIKKNFLGIDIKGDRIFDGAKKIEELGLQNAGFVRMNIYDLKNIFSDGEVDEIWIIHPDPRPKNSDRNRRLTSPRFLGIYKNILKNNGILRLKTDDIDLFKFSLENIVENDFYIKSLTFDLYNSDLLQEHFGIRTHYEKKFAEKGRKINYVKTIKK